MSSIVVGLFLALLMMQYGFSRMSLVEAMLFVALFVALMVEGSYVLSFLALVGAAVNVYCAGGCKETKHEQE